MAEWSTSLQAALADRYTIERELGHGGMATVYLAQDLKHPRKVAVKVLRPELAASLGPERFFREIEVAARLQHPHILPLHDSGEARGFLYYVMPFVEGESLRQRLVREGELPITDAVRTLTEVVDALAYAHSRGVVHRDLKPDNIMISGRQPLVMDFGIAKAVSVATGSEHDSTGGIALGTPAYMAPEQAVGDPHVDHRVDIYALGAMGYELLTGSPPFTGMSPQQLLAAQVTETPVPISTRRPTVPTALAAVLMRCLEKRPADRPQSAEEILHVLEAVTTPGGGLTPTGARHVSAAKTTVSRRWLIFIACAAIFGAVAIGTLWWRGRVGATGAAMVRHTQLTYSGEAWGAAISPDGQLLAYVESLAPSRLVVTDLAGGSVIPITAVRFEFSWFSWSHDGATILFTGVDSTGRFTTELFPRLGGPPRALTHRPGSYVLSPDGAQIAGWQGPSESPITITTLATGATRDISVPETLGLHQSAAWSPSGHAIALLTRSKSGSRWMQSTVDVETGRWRELLSDTVKLSEAAWAPGGGALYYFRGGDELRKIDIAPDGRPRGAPQILQTGLSGPDGLSITSDGRKLVYTKWEGRSNLWIATGSREPHHFTTTQLTHGTAQKGLGPLSPDGRLIAFVQRERHGPEIFVFGIEGRTPRRVTSGGTATMSTHAWSPDGQRLAFIGTSGGGGTKVRTISLDGTGERTYEGTEVGEHPQLRWAPQERILYSRPGNRNFHWLDPATEVEEPLVTNDSVGYMDAPSLSPDGRYVAVSWNRGDHPGVYVISLRDSSQYHVGPFAAWPLAWASDSKSIYVGVLGDSLTVRRVPATGGEGIAVPVWPFKSEPCNLTDRRSGLILVCDVTESVSDVWMMENFDPALTR